MKRTIILDFDNTIVEYKQTCADLHRKAAKMLGMREPREEEFARFAGLPWDHMIEKIWPEANLQEFREAYRTVPNKKRQIAGALEAIETLARENTLCILSSKSKQAILCQLSEAGIPQTHFRLVLSTEETGASKPDPNVFESLLAQLEETDRSSAIYVGDSMVDAFAAKAAGVGFIGVESGWLSKQDFEGIGVDETIPSIREMPEYLDSLPELSTVEEAAGDLRAGKFIIILDDAKRENEGDLVLAAQHATPEKTAFLIRNTSGILCAPASNEILDRLLLFPLVERNTDKFQTPFTVSADSKKCAGSGVSAEDRCTTLLSLADPSSKPEEFGRPGHTFPMRHNKKGVLARRGHTEAAVDMLRIAGLTQVAAIGELMGGDGKMLRGRRLSEFARKNGIRVIKIEDIVKYRLKNERLVKKETTTSLPTSLGNFTLAAYSSIIDGSPIIALVKGESLGKEVPVRVHSECFTGEVLFSKRCDCREQLSSAMSLIENLGKGIIIYLKQEGRGIGLLNKLRAYTLQDSGLDTVEANLKLGLRPDGREYWAAAQVLKDLGVEAVRLITNNPNKSRELEEYGIRIAGIIPLPTEPNEFNENYLNTKKMKLGHSLQPS